VLFVISLHNPAFANDKKEARNFFDQYITLSDTFDVAVASMYSDDAKIHAYRQSSQGTELILKMTGTQWKELVEKIMPQAKEEGDISKYSNITLSVKGDTIQIKADRYSVLKCFTDNGYYMIIERDKNKKFKIIEEYVETNPQANCGGVVKDENLKTLMKRNKKKLKAILPLMLDEDTKLENVKTKKKLFQYQYTLVNYTVTDLDVAAFETALTPVVANQACTTPDIKQMMDKGATISFLYNGKDGKEVSTMNVTSADCN
jgi:hypothetical protein